MSAPSTSVELEHPICGAMVRERALQMWSGMVAAGTAPVGRDYIDLVPEAAKALVADMLDLADNLGLTPTSYRTRMDPSHTLRITFGFANKIDATAFKISVL